MAEANQKKFQKLVRELSRQIRTEVDEKLPVKKSKTKAKQSTDNSTWLSAFVDARWFADADGYTAKLRVVLLNGNLHSLRTTSDMSKILKNIWSLRNNDSSPEWYGLKVTVYPDGKVITDLNNDPNCVVDPTWFHT